MIKRSNNILIHLFFILMCVAFLLPLWMIVSVSLSSEADIQQYGYRILPVKLDLTAFKYVAANGAQILRAYGVTLGFTGVGTLLSVLVMSLCAYPLSRSNFRFRRAISLYLFITMVFSGGLVPTYILISKYLHLKNSFWVYVFPTLVNVFHIFIFRTFFSGLSESLFEAAKMDGASELQIFFRIVLPISTPVFATMILFGVLGRWNEWQISLLYIDDQKLFSLQFILQRILAKLDFIKMNYSRIPPTVRARMADVPTESVRMAICLVVAGPALVIFPFFQRYFTKGITLGAVKG